MFNLGRNKQVTKGNLAVSLYHSDDGTKVKKVHAEFSNRDDADIVMFRLDVRKNRQSLVGVVQLYEFCGLTPLADTKGLYGEMSRVGNEITIYVR